MKRNSQNRFAQAKEAFLDRTDPERFVRMECNIPLLEKLHKLQDEKFKIALLKGEPGAGKSMLLKRFEQEAPQNTLFFFRPFFSIEAFEKELKRHLNIDEGTSLMQGLQTLKPYSVFVVLDEAQMYGQDFLEYIRILSDTEKIKFLLSLHTIDRENPLAQQHFTTRIFSDLHLIPPTATDLYLYIQKRLFMMELSDLGQAFKSKHAKFIHRYTKGNLRQTNKFLYTLFDILDYFERHNPSKIKTNPISKKFLEMSAMQLGYIDA